MRSSTRWLMATTFGALCTSAAFADDDGVEALLGVARESRSGGADMLETPSIVRTELPGEPQRSLPGYRSETTELGYRWWLSRGRADLGLGLGTMSYGVRPTGSVPGLGDAAASTVLASGTVMTMGVRYRTSDRSAVYADASGLRGHGIEGGEGVVGKVGVQFKLARSRFDIGYGGLGLHLSGDTRMSLRARRGGLGIVMRSSF
jgi:hypothetical protein